MVSEKEVEDIAQLADITIPKEELEAFTSQFNAILEYFEILDQVKATDAGASDLYNVFREDEDAGMLAQDDVLSNAGSEEDAFIRAPRVM
jgi:aspartyl-tRNA(Asn)/glutamyl-tRNA(Gln) amidotransferase subunit C